MLHVPGGHVPDRLDATTYIRDPDLNLLRPAASRGIAYSDGEAAEQYVHATICAARERGTFSTELARAIVDWPSEYHLSRQRHCIVRPLGIQPGDTVLELGCGCGAITRYLGEIGAEVVAVEGALPRARIAAERCRDLTNVTIVADDFLRYEATERFDWVLLIGVLEYAPVFSDGPDPIGHALRIAAGYLAPQGRLVVAIENKLGLKYFNGCAEDHVGIPFHGLQGLYGERTPRTLGRRELAQVIRDAGLPHAQFHYPFPDYKLPRIVLDERALSDPDFDAAGTLAFLQARDYGGSPYRLFDEGLAAREAARNGLLGELSNSFLVVAAREAWAPDETLAFAFSAQRKAEFATQTRFVRAGDVIMVQKTRLCPDRTGRRALADGSTLTHILGETVYVRGSPAYFALSAARARRGDLDAIVAALTPWFGFLLAKARSLAARRLADFQVPGDCLDMTPFNLVETAQGLAPIDREWVIDRDIPLGWVVTRAVAFSLWGVGGFERTAVTVVQVVEALCARHGLAVSRDEIAAWLARESELQNISSGRPLPRNAGDLASRQLAPPAYLAGPLSGTAEGTQTVAALQAQIASIYASRSWRYSYPLRLAGALLGKAAPEDAVAPAPQDNVHDDALKPSTAHRNDIKRYGLALAIVIATLALTQGLIAAGIHVPRLLLFIAAVATAARAGGIGPGVFAAAASIAAIVLPSFHQLLHDAAFAERVVMFLVCALIGILVSTPRAASSSSDTGRSRPVR